MKHGHAVRNKESSEYRAWANMLKRCNNPNHPQYKDWGGRGIKVCKRWHDFRNFLADMGPRPQGLTLERKNNNGNYEPGNCCWESWKTQNNNTRSKSCGSVKQRMFIAMDFQGTMAVSNSQSKFAKEYELNQSNISNCLHGKRKATKGWKFSWL